jgi:hypothetical protein
MLKSTRIRLPLTGSRGLPSFIQRRTYAERKSRASQPKATRESTEKALRKYYNDKFGEFTGEDPLSISLYKKVLEQINNRVSLRQKIAVRTQIVSPKLCGMSPVLPQQSYSLRIYSLSPWRR